MKSIFLLLFSIGFIGLAFGQKDNNPLFSAQTPLDIGISFSIKEVQKTKKDSSWLSHKLFYRNAAGIMDSIKISLKSRGNFRLNECYLPPLWIKIEKKRSGKTPFEGNKKLKLVLPCNNQNGSNDLILREFICYKLCEEMTSYAFKTRLVNVKMTELRGKKSKNFQLKGILIEDIEKTAKRLKAHSSENAKISAQLLQDTNALRFYMFQYLIANTDWSDIQQHNTKLVQLHNGNYIAIPYDFDMSGVVDAPYAVVSMIGNTQLPIENVRERFYNGFCKSPELTQYIRKEVLAKKEKLLSIPDLLNGELGDKEIRAIKKYLEEYFDILNDDGLFKNNILDNCRSKN